MTSETGVFRDGMHVFPVRVYFEDTDAAGVVYYANYLRFAERARTEMMRAIGVPHSGLMNDLGLVFVVHRCNAVYRRPGRLDDVLEVWSGNVGMTGTGLWLDQYVRRDGEELVGMRVRLACVGPDERPARLPRELREALSPYVGESRVEFNDNKGA
jgi:acyl-CoA thioester hydrolase